MMSANSVGLYVVPLKEYLTVGENEKLYTALKLFSVSLHEGGACKGHRLLVVLDEKGEPTGILTIKSILKAARLKILEEDITFKAEYSSWYYVKKARENGGIAIREVMRPLSQISIDYNKTISEAAKMFIRHGINFLPVKDSKKIIGILSARELFYIHYALNNFMPQGESKNPVSSKLIKKPAIIL